MERKTVKPRRISLSDLGREPFRVFFPEGVLAGLIGVALWPLHFGGVLELYPNIAHARIMAFGLFGAFIMGFLGTAMPRMLSANPLKSVQVLLLLGLHLAMVLSFAAGKIMWGDTLLLALLVCFATLMAVRAMQRKDLPPPGFVLVFLAFLCVLSGAILALWLSYQVRQGEEINSVWVSLQRLFSYQGFVLLPILGIGPFILPRFFGMQSAHDLPEALKPTAAWSRKALTALAAGVLIVGSFFLEAWGWYRTAHAIRFVTTLVYLALEFPFRNAPNARSALGASLRIAFITLLAGFLTIIFWPEFRTGLLHLTLVGGFAVITFVVATRVVFGHSGNLDKLKDRNRWLLWAVGLMLFAMATRISGDFWPKILVSHYNYGALVWAIGVAIWAWKVLPKVLEAEDE